MVSLIPAFLAILAEVSPAISATSAIAKIITTLTSLIPLLVDEYNSLKPVVLNIITALKGNNNISEEQWDALDVLEKQIDNDYNAAKAAVQNEDKK